MIGRNFTAKEKLRILEKCERAEWSVKQVRRIAREASCHWVTVYGWRRQYDGTLESLQNKPPNNHQPRQHSKEQTALLKRMMDENPGIGRMELYARLRLEMGYVYSIRTMDREIRRQNFVAPPSEKVKAELQPYDTPNIIGVKWQIDVKYVPACCLRKIPESAYYYRDGYRLYQFTCIDEASRKRFMFIYDRIGKHQARDFIKRCILFFGYKPLIIQTDNGHEFCTFTEVGGRKAHKKTKEGKYHHLFTRFLDSQEIRHDLIKVATPRHNGKVERSHRTDNQEFYIHFQDENGFVDLAHARECQKDWVYRYNNRRAMCVLKYKTPQQVEDEMMTQLRETDGRVTYIDLERPKGSGNKPFTVEREGSVKFMPRHVEWAQADRPIKYA